MPLDTSTYDLALLRVDGRRWNELRKLHGQVRLQAAADGSSYLEMGNTKVMCTVSGPSEPRRGAGGLGTATTGGGGGGTGGGGGSGGGGSNAEINVSVVVAGFSTVDRKKRGRNDKRILELQAAIGKALAATLHTHLYPRSAISVSLHVLSQDGSLLAALLNASTLALVDAGVPMADYLCACTAGSTSAHGVGDDNVDNQADPLIDLNSQEEAELPHLTLATLGATDRVAVLVCESRVQAARLEGMMASAADGCRHVRAFLDRVVRDQGRRMVREGAVERGARVAMDMDLDMDA